MVHCISDTCREQIDEGWSFCPFCGTDNRPPEYHPHIKDCRHQFVGSKGYCVLCGAKYKGFAMYSGKGQIKFGIVLIGLGCSLFLIAFVIWSIHNKGSGPGYEWISSWYDQTYLARSKGGNTYVQQRGFNILTWMILIGMLLVFAGGAMLSPKNKGNQSFNDWEA
jgi:hypothetical protein